MRVIIASDHGGFELKNYLYQSLKSNGFDITDAGTHNENSVDYPEIAKNACDKIVSGEFDRGILVCGTGIGISMSANKVAGIRAAACQSYFAAKYTRLHNDANVLCLGGRITGNGSALEMAEVFLKNEFEGDRHQKRIDMMTKMEQK